MSIKLSSAAELEALSGASSKAVSRLTFLFDDGKFTETGRFVKSGDALSGVITAFGYVEGVPVYAFSQDISAKSGALTKEGAAKISKLYTLAAETGAPVVGIYDSYGADVSDDDAQSAFAYLKSRFGDNLEFSLVNGGQPVYYYIVSVE